MSSRRLPLSAGSARGGARGSLGLVAREKGERGRRRGRAKKKVGDGGRPAGECSY